MADITILKLPGDRLELDHAAGHRHIERFIPTGPEYRQLDRRTFGTAHLRHCLIEGLANDELAIEMSDVVARLETGPVGGAAAERRNDLHGTIVLDNGKSEAGIITVDHCFEALEIAAVEIAGVRIERGQHAIDHAANEHVVFDRLHITGLDALIDRQNLGEFGTGTAIDLRKAGGSRRD